MAVSVGALSIVLLPSSLAPAQSLMVGCSDPVTVGTPNNADAFPNSSKIIFCLAPPLSINGGDGDTLLLARDDVF